MNQLPDLACACATLRRATRLITQIYDEELRPHLESSQFALLSAIEKLPACKQGLLADALGYDKTSVSRSLTLLHRNGWIEQATADDRRERGYKLSRAGVKVLYAARPGWQRAQDRLRAAMAADEWTAMWPVLRALTNSAARARR